MKIFKLLFAAALVGAVATLVKKQKQLAPPSADGIWKPVDPLKD